MADGRLSSADWKHDGRRPARRVRRSWVLGVPPRTSALRRRRRATTLGIREVRM